LKKNKGQFFASFLLFHWILTSEEGCEEEQNERMNAFFGSVDEPQMENVRMVSATKKSNKKSKVSEGARIEIKKRAVLFPSGKPEREPRQSELDNRCCADSVLSNDGNDNALNLKIFFVLVLQKSKSETMEEKKKREEEFTVVTTESHPKNSPQKKV
jgi:hypothetical protein